MQLIKTKYLFVGIGGTVPRSTAQCLSGAIHLDRSVTRCGFASQTRNFYLEWRMPLPPVLDRYLEAQELMWARVLVELKAGKKRSHWMWFVFPQIKGLGHSDMAARYAIQSRAEATAYLGHPVLGSRLREACNALLALEILTAHEILGTPDDLKLRSSMTLFAEVSEPGDVFGAVLEKYFDGKKDARTLALLG